MPEIRLETIIHAEINLVFDLSRSIDLHQVSTAHTEEKVVAGRFSGLIELGETVTWQARHFGIIQQLSSKITAMQKPDLFTDEMVKGAFKAFKHDHFFVSEGQTTLMTDVFNYASPLGFLGKAADRIFLFNYMKTLLIKRNEVIRSYAENGLGAQLLLKHH